MTEYYIIPLKDYIIHTLEHSRESIGFEAVDGSIRRATLRLDNKLTVSILKPI